MRSIAKSVRSLLQTRVETILSQAEDPGILLSGGVDSMTIAIIASKLHPTLTAYTLVVEERESSDTIRARAIASALKMPHRMISVSESSIVGSIQRAIELSELYHLYNVYCAVGMTHRAHGLHQVGVSEVLPGEGANSAFGDYGGRSVTHPLTGKLVTLQKTPHLLTKPRGREAYSFGNTERQKKGFYNVQLGSGLSKHGCGRMYKPMFHYGFPNGPFLDRES